MTYSMKTEAGTVRFDNPLARRIVAALAHGPQPLRQLGEPNHLMETVINALALASAGIIRPVNKRDTAVSALNDVLVEFDSEAVPLPFRALPSGTALQFEPALHRYLLKRGRLPRRLRAWPNFLAQAITAKD